LAVSALTAREPPAFDCLTQEPTGKDQAPFFICLNIRREGCGELLRKMQAECGQESAKYKLVFDRYLALRTRANLLLDTVASDLRLGRKPRPDAYAKAMVEVAEAVREFEGLDQGLTCEGTPTRLLAELATLITPALTEKLQEWVKAWMGGKKDERDARANELATQRWKLPSELGAPFPGKPAATAS
jgi:hypothetical protein